jgi:hypothetical protein
MPYTYPASDKRAVIVGSTGSGKTFVACWLLAFADWHKRPWYILDYKGDQLIRDIRATDIDVNEEPPTEPGLYRLALIPDMDDKALAKFFWRIWENENSGIYLDEGFMINRNDTAFKALLTQGRSKNIQMITLVQRPVFCSKFIFSEANHFYVMKLQIEDDRKYVSGYLDGTPINRLPRFHSYVYNADDQEGVHLGPVPGRAAILDLFNHRRAQMAMEQQKAAEQFKSERFVAI